MFGEKRIEEENLDARLNSSKCVGLETEDTSKEYNLKVSLALLKDARLSPYDKMVYMAIKSEMDRYHNTNIHREIHLTVESIRKLCGISKSTILRSIAHLEKFSLLVTKSTGRGQVFYMK